MSLVNSIQVQKFLKGIDSPAKKTTVLENANNMGRMQMFAWHLQRVKDIYRHL